jgi:thiol-disulfide isomerase/thioredoxin
MKLSVMVFAVTLLFAALAAPLLEATQDGTKGVEFEDQTRLFRETLAKAKESGRIVMLDLFTDWCGPCKKLDAETYSDPAVGAFMKKFVNMKINAEFGEGPGLAKGYKLMAYPTIFFLDGDGREIDWIVGFLPPRKFLERVREIHAGKNTYRSLKARYEKDKTDLDGAVGYAGKLKERGDREDQNLSITIYAEALTVARKDKNPLAGECIGALIPQKLRAGDYDGVAALIEEQIADYPKTDRIENSYNLLAQIEAKIRKNLDRAIDLMKKSVALVEGTDNETSCRYTLLSYLEEKGDFDGALHQLDRIDIEEDPLALYGDRVRLIVKKGEGKKAETFCREWRVKAGDDPEKINGVAWCCHENKILLADALKWAEKMIKLCKEETPALMDTYAWLLFDNGDPVAAAEWEEKALFAAETNEENEAYAVTLKTFRDAIEKKDD